MVDLKLHTNMKTHNQTTVEFMDHRDELHRTAQCVWNSALLLFENTIHFFRPPLAEVLAVSSWHPSSAAPAGKPKV